MKLTKENTRRHDEAEALINSDRVLTRDEQAFCFEHYRPGANHNIGKGGIFFTSTDMATTLANMHAGGGRILDACAGIGVLARAILDQDWGKAITELVCLENNPEFVRIGQRLVPEARWVRGDIFHAATIRKLGLFDSAVSNPPFGNLPRESDYCRHNAPAHLMVAEVLIRRCEQGAVMIIPASDHSREDSDHRPSTAYLRFRERFPEAYITPLAVDCSCFNFHGAKPACAMVNLECPNVQLNPYLETDV